FPVWPRRQLSTARREGKRWRCLSRTPTEARGGGRSMALRAAADAVVEPDILKSRGVVDAVHAGRQPLDVRLPAVCRLVVEQDRSGIVLDQLPLDFPHQLLALVDVRFSRLFFDQRIDLAIAIAGVVAHRTGVVV